MTQVIKEIGTTTVNDTLWFYLGVYVGISVLTCVIGSIRYALMLMASIRASRNLFDKLTYAVLRAPLRWLDTIPLGRILNRFTADFNMIDSKLAYDFGFMLYNILQVLGIVVAGLVVSPILIVFAFILLLISFYYSQLYLSGAREIKRLESNAKSPIFEQFGSALIGLGTIRAFGKAQTYVERMYGKIDMHAQAYWNLWLFNRWFGFRMNVVGAVFSTITAVLIVYAKGIDASLAGFALSFALQYTNAIAWALRQYANVELDMNATERVLEYADIAIENQGGIDVPAAWPTQGRLEVSDLVVGYAPDLPAVLQGLSFNVDTNQRVGVVGRTGAGKSSLTLALFRFLEAREGQIYIDGIDVSKIKLHDLRGRLAIIPQDPVLFSGTIRSNLDPFDEYTDAELRDALERVHLVTSTPDYRTESRRSSMSTSSPQSVTGTGAITPTVTSTSSTATSTTANSSTNVNTNIFKSLSSSISEGGLNLSQGQRQLLCLARAIVSRPKIMVLDEATSAVDMATDALIQHSIRSEFGRNSTTLLVIAHRISTIADFDRILVMDAGKAVEFGAPRELMEIEGGVFRSLVEESGEREKLKQVILGGC
jgi:ABC-type multidrug transport system fused ATPase/permease subunit